MSDLISRQDALAAVQKLHWVNVEAESPNPWDTDLSTLRISMDVGAIRRAIKDVPAAQEGWVSVKERLPELGQEVLVYAVGKIDGFIGEHVYALCSRFVQRLFPSSPGYERWSTPWEYFHTDYEITHWMSMPEPPKEGETNE